MATKKREKAAAAQAAVQPVQGARTTQYLAARMEQGGESDTMVWYSGADVRRFDYERGDWLLRLPLSGARLGRLQAGAPLVKDHRYERSVDDVLAAFTGAWVENGRGMGRVKWADTEDAKAAKRLVASGILGSVSMEVQIDGYTNVTEPGGKVPVFQATGWEPMCVALVAVPADQGSHFLSAEDQSRMPVPVVDVAARELTLALVKIEMARLGLGRDM